jgi:hypothetical protein
MQRIVAIGIYAATLVTPLAAFAQSSPSPNNTAGPGISPTAPAPTDMGAGADDSNRKGVPSRPAGTTGAGVEGSGSYREMMTPGAVRPGPEDERPHSPDRD